MGFRIVIAGKSQCDVFAQICLVANHLKENLSNFCYDTIQKSVLEWETWLCKINHKNKWHHLKSPLIWKELLMKGSKPYYIGGASEFLDYCHSYYQFDSFLLSEKFKGLTENFSQYQNKIKNEKETNIDVKDLKTLFEKPSKNNFTICISGTGSPIAMHILSGLLEMSVGEKNVSKIYIYDDECSETFMEFIERECSYIRSNNSGKVVKVVNKIGTALTHTDLLIILNHIPFNIESSIGDWLQANKKMMTNLAMFINASAYRKMNILFPNLGPACFNATVLMNLVTNIPKRNIVVATSDLGLDIAAIAAEIAEIPMRNMFCPPVWGFVGINHLVDIRTTFHKYNSFEPYNRYTKVNNSSLTIGSLTPVMRTMEYLMYFDETLWPKVAEKKSKMPIGHTCFNKATAALNVVNLWLLDNSPTNIVNLGILCDSSFGLTFQGAFSQPARLVDDVWMPANEFLMPRDAQMKLPYMEKIANLCMNMNKGDFPKIVKYHPCYCKPKYYKTNKEW